MCDLSRILIVPSLRTMIHIHLCVKVFVSRTLLHAHTHTERERERDAYHSHALIYIYTNIYIYIYLFTLLYTWHYVVALTCFSLFRSPSFLFFPLSLIFIFFSLFFCSLPFFCFSLCTFSGTIFNNLTVPDFFSLLLLLLVNLFLSLVLVFLLHMFDFTLVFALRCADVITLVWNSSKTSLSAPPPSAIPSTEGLRVGLEFVNAKELSDVVFMVCFRGSVKAWWHSQYERTGPE